MIPIWLSRLPTNLIWSKARDAAVDPYILASIVWAESKGFVYANRFEPKYRYLWRPAKYAKKHGTDIKTERNLQMQSYGLGQIMGGTARWIGFNGALPQLYKPENNLFWCAKYVSYLHMKYEDYEKVVSAYNQGTPLKQNGEYRNQKYVDEVYEYYKELVSC